MFQGSRPNRVGELIRGELGVQLTRFVRDPGVRHVTITHVRMSKDLRQAHVLYTLSGNEDDRRDTSRALRRARSFLRSQLGRRLELRHVPELTFEYDDSVERTDRLALLFKQIESEPRSEPEG